jgi:dihydroflavonol-4-reductase
MKALVTGGTGFIGSHIVRVLVEAGHQARVLHRQNSKMTALSGLSYESAIGDILDLNALCAACEGCDWVFHVAAVADYWRADQSKMFEANVEGTRRVLDAARQTGVKRIVHTSSAAAVGLRDDGKPGNETLPFNLPPEHFSYGYSKALSERVVMEAVENGQDVVTVNPVVVMGPGDLNMISGSFITQIKQYGHFAPVTSGGIAVVDVRDVARWELLAVEKGHTGERYILGTANYTYTELFAIIADTVGVGRPFIYVPNFLLPLSVFMAELAARLKIKLPVNADQIRLSGRNVYFEYDKTWTELGTPQVEMRDSIRATYQWYRANGYLS